MSEPVPELQRPGRSCPLGYRTQASDFAQAAALRVETLWVAGGLYGNRDALERLLELYAAEPGAKALVFNGDFHWFDVDAGEFAAIEEGVAPHVATRGNVETEIARPADGAGCGCAYPGWVGEETVAHSNRIIERLRATAQAFPAARARLGALPMTLVAEVGGQRVAIVHGDAGSLAGWGFSQERLASAEGLAAAEQALHATGASVIASSHTCLPVLQAFGADRAIVNNGAAGMPNFAGTRYGIATRISLRASAAPRYGLRIGSLAVEAIAIDYDAEAWTARFLAQWPPGSDAHASYFARILNGPRYLAEQALRPIASGMRDAA